MGSWIETLRGMAFPYHCDHMGHVNNRWYAFFFDDASLSMWSQVALSEKKLRTLHDTGAVVANVVLDFHHELLSGEQFLIRSAFTRVGNKSVTYVSRLYICDDETLCATQRAVAVFFDHEQRTSRPVPQSVRDIVDPLVVDDVDL